MPRTYQPRPMGGLVGIPQPPDVLQSLSGLMQMGRQMEAYTADQQERRKAKLLKDSYNASGGDLLKTADLIEQAGDRMTADGIRKNAQTIRAQMLDGVVKKVTEHKTIHGAAREMLGQVQQDPSTYAALRPKFVEMASALDPRLASEIPEQYDPQRVAGMAQFVEQGSLKADERLKAAADLKALQTAQIEGQERYVKELGVVGRAMMTADTPEEWASTRRTLTTMGISEAALGRVPAEFSPTAVEQARKLTLTGEQLKPAAPEKVDPIGSIEEGYARAVASGNKAEIAKWTKAKSVFAAQGREPKETAGATDPAVVDVVAENPQLFWGLPPSARAELIGPLAKRKFDFSKSVEGIEPGTLALRRLDDIRALNARRDSRDGMADEDYEAGLARIEELYRGLGLGPKRNEVTGRPGASRDSVLPPDRRSAAAPAAPAAAPARPAAAPAAGVPPAVAERLKGQAAGVYTLRDGTKYRVGPDGAISAVR